METEFAVDAEIAALWGIVLPAVATAASSFSRAPLLLLLNTPDCLNRAEFMRSMCLKLLLLLLISLACRADLGVAKLLASEPMGDSCPRADLGVLFCKTLRMQQSAQPAEQGVTSEQDVYTLQLFLRGIFIYHGFKVLGIDVYIKSFSLLSCLQGRGKYIYHECCKIDLVACSATVPIINSCIGKLIRKLTKDHARTQAYAGSKLMHALLLTD